MLRSICAAALLCVAVQAHALAVASFDFPNLHMWVDGLPTSVGEISNGPTGISGAVTTPPMAGGGPVFSTEVAADPGETFHVDIAYRFSVHDDGLLADPNEITSYCVDLGQHGEQCVGGSYELAFVFPAILLGDAPLARWDLTGFPASLLTPSDAKADSLSMEGVIHLAYIGVAGTAFMSQTGFTLYMAAYAQSAVPSAVPEASAWMLLLVGLPLLRLFRPS